MRERAFYMILLLDRFYLLRCIMTSVMQCLPAQLPDLPTSALASLNESVLVQVGLATQANSKRPKQHLKLSKAQTFSIEDLPDEVTTALIYQNFLHQDLCSLAQVSWRYRHLSVSTASKLDRLGIKAPGSLLVSVEFACSPLTRNGRPCTSKLLATSTTSPERQQYLHSRGKSSSGAKRCRTGRQSLGTQHISTYNT